MADGGKVKATLPTAFDSEQQVQVKAHRDAVAVFEAYGKSGDNADLKNWASQTLPHLKEHLQHGGKAEIRSR